MAQRMNSFPHGDKPEIYKSTNTGYDKNLKSSFNVRKHWQVSYLMSSQSTDI